MYQNCELRKNNCTSFASKGNPETDDKRDEELEKQESELQRHVSRLREKVDERTKRLEVHQWTV